MSASRSTIDTADDHYNRMLLKLACGQPVLLLRQLVRGVSNFSTRYVHCADSSDICRMFMNLPFDNPAFTVFDFTTCIDGDCFIPRTYGQWWDKAPSGLKEDFMPQNNDLTVGHDFVDFMFDEEVYPVRLCIFETVNPGCIIRIWASDCDSKLWHKLWSGPVEHCSARSRIFFPSFKICRFKTKILRLELSHSHLDYYTQLYGAILIGSSELILPLDECHNPCLESLYLTLGDPENNEKDAQSVPVGSSSEKAVDNDYLKLREKLEKNYRLYKSENVDEVPKGKLLSVVSINESPSGGVSIIDTCDIFDALPDETLLKILKILDLKSLCHCSQVNRRFNYVTRDALLYTSLNLKPYWNLVNAATLSYLTPRCKYLRRLDLSWCVSYETFMINAKDINNFLKACGSLLTNLRLNCCRFVNDSVVEEISSTCKSLKELCLNNCREISNNGLENLKKLKSLERLELYRTRIETSTLCSILQRNLEMRHLNLAETPKELDMDRAAIEIADFCPRLESIDCWYSRTLSFAGLRAFSRCTNLREIDFGWCPQIYNLNEEREDSIRTLLSCCGSLEKIGLAAQPFLTDRDLEPLFLNHRLQQLHLGGATKLTPEFYSRLLSSCTQLRMVDLSGCKDISDTDLLKMQKLYPHVSIKWP